VRNEPYPNGYCINIGAYGSTNQAASTKYATLTVSPDPIDFGYFEADDKIEKYFYLKNGSPDTVNIFEITVSDSEHFSLLSFAENDNQLIERFTLVPGEIDSMIIQFSASSYLEQNVVEQMTIKCQQCKNKIIELRATLSPDIEPPPIVVSPPDTLWTRTYGDVGQDRFRGFIINSDGEYVLCGYTDSFGKGGIDVYLVKTDTNGNKIWENYYGGTNHDWGNRVQQTPEGGYIIVGMTESYGAGKKDVYLIKTDPQGDTTWTKTYGGPDDDVGTTILQSYEGGYIILAATKSFGSGKYDLWIIKTDTNGDTIKTKTYGGAGNEGFLTMQSGLYCSMGAIQTTDGNYMFSTFTNSFCGPDLIDLDVWLLKTDTNLDTIWTKTYGGSEEETSSYCTVQQVADGGYVFTGSRKTEYWGWPYQPDVYLQKVDAKGDSIWYCQYGGPLAEIGFWVEQTNDLGYIIAGDTRSEGAGGWDFYLVKTDSSGRKLWTKTVGGKDREFGYVVHQTWDGKYVVAGATESYGAGYFDGYLVKVDSDLITAVEKEHENDLPKHFSLDQNYPNPFNPNTIISYQLSKAAEVKLDIFNILGQKVVTLVSEPQQAGNYKYEWDGSGLTSGLYIYRIRAGGFVDSKKLVLLK